MSAPLMTPAEVVGAYWEAMRSNDFGRAARWFADEFRIYWPQSQEIIASRADFVALNSAYPAHGRWTFDLNRLVAGEDQVVTDVTISDGKISARAVTFHRIAGERIVEQVEYWPEEYPAPAWRRAWVSTGQPPGA